MKKIHFDGQDFWLMTACPDWDHPVRLTLEMAGETAIGLSDRESGRSVFEKLRVAEFAYSTWLDGANARGFVRSLQQKVAEPCLIPVWPLARPSTEFSGQPWRAQYYACYELVDGDVVFLAQWQGRSTLVHSATTSKSFTVPCIVGDFVDGGPSLIAEDDELLSIDLAFQEKALAHYALEIVDMAYESGPEPDYWPMGADAPTLFPLGIDWTQAPTSGVQRATDRQKVGYSRLPTETVHGGWPVKEYEWTAQCMSANDVARLGGFFQEMGGIAGRFWVPGTTALCQVEEDVAAAAYSLTVAGDESIYVGSWLAVVDPFLDSFQVTRVAARSEGLLDLVLPVANVVASRASVVEAVLARFSKTKLSLTFTSDESAMASLVLRELPWESRGLYPETMGRQAMRTSLYQLKDMSSGQEWRYTSFERELSWDGNSFEPYPITHGNMKQTVTLEDDCPLEAEVRSGSPFLALLQLKIPRLQIKVIRVKLSGGNVSEVLRTFIGEAHQAKVSGRVLKCTVKGQSREIDGIFPRMRFSRLCSYCLFSEGCGLSKAAWTISANITSITAGGKTLGMNLYSVVPISADFFAWGYLSFGGVKTMIRSNTALSSGSIVMEVEPIPGIALGDLVTVVPECDGRAETCRAFGNFENFGGNMVADGNLSLVKVGTNQTAGGKK